MATWTSFPSKEPRCPDLPASFRQELVPHVFKAMLDGWSVSLVGTRGSGKSNLLRFLCHPRVVRDHVEAPQSHLLVYVDDHLIPDYGEASFCRALLDSTAQAARENVWPDQESGPLFEAARYYAEYERQMGGIGVISRVMDILCREKRKRVVLALDDFDEAFVRLDVHTLRSLRAIRDNHKNWLSFVVGTRLELSRLAARRDASEQERGVREFWTLFEYHTFGIKPYRRDDAADLISRKTMGTDQPLSSEQVDRLLQLTGGHAGLLMAGLAYLEPRRDAPLTNLARGLGQDPEVARCCQEIWDDLDGREQALAIKLAAGVRENLPADEMRRLQSKGLVVGHPPFLFSDLWEEFVKRHADEHSPQARTAADEPVTSQHKWPWVIRDPEEIKYW